MDGTAPAAAPADRVRTLVDAAVRPEGAFVLYWMTTARRTRFTFALDHAIATARSLGRPLVVLEALRVAYPWASDRLHRFVLEGMRDQEAAFAGSPVTYYAYVEPTPGAGSGLVEAFAARACVVVTDDYPAFFIPRMLAAASRSLTTRLEAVDGNGLVPMHAAGRAFSSAQQFRRFLQHELPTRLNAWPASDPLADLDLPRLDPDHASDLAQGIAERWPRADLARIDLASLPIDHTVPPAPIKGGARAGGARLAAFLDGPLARYGEGRNHPDDEDASGLSPYVHFGHVGAHEVVHAILQREGWTPERLTAPARGQRAGWWGLSPGAEAFVDQVVTWRELGFNACAADPTGYDRYESIPAWAQRTLAAHADDPRDAIYEVDALAGARTSDPVWNAAQRQLVRDGRLHNYLRMLWGKRILEWSPTPRDALATMIELNNRYALDGRDPNSYSGILWCLGKFDRAWGPERPIFGTVRYMSSANTVRKLRMRGYLQRYGDERDAQERDGA